MMMARAAAAVGILVGLMFAPLAVATTCVNFGTDLVVDGNKSVDICLKTVSGGTPRTFSYQLFGAGSWAFDGAGPVASPTSSAGVLTVTNGVSGTEQHYTVVTSGVPISGAAPSATHYGQFLFCYKPALNVMCMDSGQFLQRVRLKVDPVVRPSVAGPITTNGTTSVTVTLGDAGDNPTAGAVVNAACTAANGATVSVSPASRTTSAGGTTPAFTITTGNLVVYAPSGTAPSGVCTFSTAAGTKSQTVNIQGQRLSPTVSVSPQQVDLPGGSTTLANQSFTVSTTPAAVNVPIAALCSGTTSPASATLTTDSLGKAVFTTTASDMVKVSPTGRPVVSCSFTLGTLQPANASIRGVQLSRAITLSPNVVTGTGTTPIQASLVTLLGNTNQFPGFTINANCTSTRPDVPIAVTPTTPATNSQGYVVFSVASAVLGFADASTVTSPPAKCVFKLGSDGIEQTIYMPYSNVCTSPSMAPLPAVCGNP